MGTDLCNFQFVCVDHSQSFPFISFTINSLHVLTDNVGLDYFFIYLYVCYSRVFNLDTYLKSVMMGSRSGLLMMDKLGKEMPL